MNPPHIYNPPGEDSVESQLELCRHWLDEARTERDRLRAGIEKALKYAARRWFEWGTRAEGVEDILRATLAGERE